MSELRTGLLRRNRKCAGKSRRLSNIRPQLVFRRAHEKSAQNANEISALSSELVFRQIPGQLVQRDGQAQRLRRRIHSHRALLEPPGRGVVRVLVAPPGLCFLPPRSLAFRFPAGALARSDSRVRPKPLPTNRAWSLPDLGHGDPSWSPRRAPGSLRFRAERMGQF